MSSDAASRRAAAAVTRSPESPRRRANALVFAVLLAGCERPSETCRECSGASVPTGTSGTVESPPATDEPLVEIRTITVADDPASPLYTRGFVFSPDGTKAYLADAPNRVVKIVPLDGSSPKTLDVSSIGVPARLFLLGDFVYLTFRDTAHFARIAPFDGNSLTLVDLPSTAEGIALEGNSLHVACRDGTLLTLEAEPLNVTRTLALPSDLRDVLPRGDGTLFVTRFRSAELLLLDENGKITKRIRPAREGVYEPAVAWKTLLLADGNAIMLHLLSRGVRGSDGFYSNDGPAHLTASVLVTEPTPLPIGKTPTDDLLDPYRGYTTDRSLGFGSGFGDLAASGDGFALIRPGKSMARPEDAYAPPSLTPLEAFDDAVSCFFVAPNRTGSAHCFGSETLTAVATHPLTGVAWVLDHGESRLRALDGSGSLEFGEKTKNDAFSIFHFETGGVSCATCHPEGREDGLEWDFEGFPTRTQTLEAGLGKAPMHRRGELATLGDFMNSVFRDRFFGTTLNPAQLELMTSFLAGIDAPPPFSQASNESGKALFESPELGCVSCHSGPLGSDDSLHDVGTGGSFLTPPLFRIGYREPYLHDGAARTLFDVFGLAGGGDEHNRASTLSKSELAALVAYLASL